MAKDQCFVIIGAGHAGGRAAQAMRMAGFDGCIVLVGEEPHVPYERPPLSKELLITDQDLAKAQLHPPSYYQEQSIELLLGVRAEAIDPKAHTVKLSDGRDLAYTKLLITTGARVRKL